MPAATRQAVGTVRQESCQAAARKTTRAPLRQPQRREQVLFAATVLAHGEHLCVSVLVVDWHLCSALRRPAPARRVAHAVRTRFVRLVMARSTAPLSNSDRPSDRPSCTSTATSIALSTASDRQCGGAATARGTIEMTLSLSPSNTHRTDTRQRWRPTTRRAHIVAKKFQTLLLFLSCSRFLYDLGNV